MAKKGGNQDGKADPVTLYEDLCRRCGMCCHQKVRFGDVVVITDVPCEFLDTTTNLCTVYPERFAKQPLCSSAEASVLAGALPGDCPYVGGVSDYQDPLLLRDHPEYEQAVNALFPERLKGAAAKVNIKALKYGRGKKQP